VEKSEKRARIETEYFTPDDLDRIYTITVKAKH
jgi:hypothetical protein